MTRKGQPPAPSRRGDNRRIEQAAELHRIGRSEEAVAIYRSLLAENPEHADALHLLGVYHCQRKDFAGAVPLLASAAEKAPDFPDARIHLAKALRRIGRAAEAADLLEAFIATHAPSEELLVELARAGNACNRAGTAIAAYRQALQLSPDSFVAHAGLADLLRRAGSKGEAVNHYRQALARRPDDVVTLNSLATLQKELGKHDEAVHLLRKAIGHKHDFAVGHNNLGNLLLDAGKIDEAIAAYRTAIAHQPEFPEAWNNLGNALKEAGRTGEAIEAYRVSLRLRPDYAEAMSNCGNALLAEGRQEEATALQNRALALRPDFSEAWNNLANIHITSGHPEAALTAFEKAVNADPASHQARFGRGLARLMLGDFSGGWEDYEHRWWGSHMSGRISPPKFNCPQWDGSTPRPGERILVYHEQGFGDTIQFARYLPMLATRFGSVTCICQEELHSLFAASFGQIASIVSNKESSATLRKTFDWHSPVLSLPRAFKTTGDNIPGACPYLVPPAGALATWRRKIGAAPLRVGLCGQGNPELKDDQRRSLPADVLATLGNQPGIAWYNLTKADAGKAMPLPGMSDPMPDVQNFGDTAALIACLDLVITVDTAIAHLAGALGKPVWLLCRHASEWRWQWQRQDSPWYPSMRIHRQQRQGDWQDVIAAVAGRLSEIAHASGKNSA